MQVLIRDRWIPDQLRHRTPKSELGKLIHDTIKYVPAEMGAELLERLSSIIVIESKLSIVIIRRNGTKENIGIVGNKVITTVGVNFLVDAWQNLVELENEKFHALGTGSTAEDVGDTALVTELTTEYTGNVRATGSLAEGASANIFRTIGTNTLDGAPGAALREHGIFDQAATGGGTLWDRTVFGALTLNSGDGMQTTYDMTATAGG